MVPPPIPGADPHYNEPVFPGDSNVDIWQILGLAIVLCVLAAIPSSSVALIIARSATAGFANGAAAALGIVAGDLVFVVLALTGLAALTEILGGLFVMLRIAGGVYLVWLGISMLVTLRSVVESPLITTAGGNTGSFLAGLAITLGDIKAIFFYLSLFPLFVDTKAVTGHDLVLIGTLTVGCVGSVKLVYAALGALMAGRLSGQAPNRAMRATAGTLMTGSGLYLILKH